jgi:predicted transcriptional regulator
MSIHPRFAEDILAGKKQYELRRVRPQFPPGTIIWVYATKPMGWVVGWFESGSILSGSPPELWARLGSRLGIDIEAFDHYLRGRKQVFAIEIKNPRLLSRRPPKPRVIPQSYLYLDDSAVRAMCKERESQVAADGCSSPLDMFRITHSPKPAPSSVANWRYDEVAMVGFSWAGRPMSPEGTVSSGFASGPWAVVPRGRICGTVFGRRAWRFR